jgi:flagellar motility protein MotE (MotC chaperone)
MDYASLDALRSHHPAWRMLASPHAVLAASFLHRAFVVPNVRTIPSADLAEALEDQLYALRASFGHERFPKPAIDYLNDWAASDKGWLRKFYKSGTDEAQFDITPSTAKAIAWLETLADQGFIGTESRLLTLFDLLRQMSEGSETDPLRRLEDLRSRRQAIDDEIARVAGGDIPVLEDTALRDRFQQFTQMARELLTDFRQVEENFRVLDRNVRERMAVWEGGKGSLLEKVMAEREAISVSDQGRSFRAFWDFLMSQQRQEELTSLLTKVLALPAIEGVHKDPRLRRVHYDWLEAGEFTQRTVAQLSQQLRRFLDDQAWLENRRIMDILRRIESHAITVRDSPPAADIASIDDAFAGIDLPFERPLFRVSERVAIEDLLIEAGQGDFDIDALYSQVRVDVARLAETIAAAISTGGQASLKSVIEGAPLEHGLAELVAYLQLGSERFTMVVDESVIEPIQWVGESALGRSIERSVALPRILFTR